MSDITGRIVELQRSKGYGFFRTRDGRRIYFHFSEKVEPEDILTEGDCVSASLAMDGQGRYAAMLVRRLRTPL